MSRTRDVQRSSCPFGLLFAIVIDPFCDGIGMELIQEARKILGSVRVVFRIRCSSASMTRKLTYDSKISNFHGMSGYAGAGETAKID